MSVSAEPRVDADEGTASTRRPPLTTGQRRLLAGILVAAALVRVAWVLYAARMPQGLHDPSLYHHLGETLAEGDGYRYANGPTAYYPPGFPLVLSVVYWFVQRTPLNDEASVGFIATLNILWQLGATFLVFETTRRLTRAVPPALVAAAVFAFWPNLVHHTAVALTESLFIVLSLGAVYLVVAGPWERGRFELGRLAAVGALLGAATLVRPVSLPLFPVLFVAWLVARFGVRRAFGHLAVVAGVALAVLAPWLIRNVVVMDALTLSTNTGDNLCMSRYVGGSGGFEYPNDRCFEGPFDALDRPEFETARDAHGRELAWEFIREHPLDELALVPRRLYYTFQSDTDGLRAVESYGADRFLPSWLRTASAWLANGYALLAGLAALPGLGLLLWRGVRGDAAALLVPLAVIATIIPPLLFFGEPRFHVPAVPFAAVAVGVLFAVRSRPRPVPAPASTGAATGSP